MEIRQESEWRPFLASRELRINDRIRVREVRLIDEAGEQMGVLATEEAIRLAQDRGLDLVEVAPSAQPPVCRILDYGKFKYEQSKKESDGRKKQKNASLREVKVRPNIGKHDRDFKIRTAAKLLREGDKVKITVQFRGREITHPEIGRERIKEIMATLEAEGIPLNIEKSLSMEGRFMNVIVAEDKVKAASLAKEAATAAKEQAATAAKEQAAASAAEDQGAAPEQASDTPAPDAPAPETEAATKEAAS